MRALRTAASVLLLLPLGGCIAMIGTDGQTGLEKRVEKLEKRIQELEKAPTGDGQVRTLPKGIRVIGGRNRQVHEVIEVVPENPK